MAQAQSGDAGSLCLDIGIFAHNEAGGIGAMLRDLMRQDVFQMSEVDLRIWVLANGCSDGTVTEAEAVRCEQPSEIQEKIQILDLPEGGKSRTMHRYIHSYARAQADLLAFMDADIRLPRADVLTRMVTALRDRPELQAYVSRPVKDVDHAALEVGTVARLIAAGGGGLGDFRKAICGQLFMLRAPMARKIALPIGLPVEDGFIRAMVVTEMLSRAEDLDRIDGDEDVFHVYESIRSLPELLRHQTRLVVGSAVNTALFDKIRREAPTPDAARALLMAGASDPNWLAGVLKTELPRRPYGYVHFSFLTHRISGGKLRASLARGPKALMVTLAGVGLDVLVYLRASLRMMAGKAAGHW